MQMRLRKPLKVWIVCITWHLMACPAESRWVSRFAWSTPWCVQKKVGQQCYFHTHSKSLIRRSSCLDKVDLSWRGLILAIWTLDYQCILQQFLLDNWRGFYRSDNSYSLNQSKRLWGKLFLEISIVTQTFEENVYFFQIVLMLTNYHWMNWCCSWINYSDLLCIVNQ